jgi:hypothetical protein
MSIRRSPDSILAIEAVKPEKVKETKNRKVGSGPILLDICTPIKLFVHSK